MTLLQGIFQPRVTAAEHFSQRLDENPYYPFVRLGPNTFHLRIRYYRFYVSIATTIVSVILLIIFSALDEFLAFQFAIAAAALVISVAVLITYKDAREYTLDGTSNTYKFKAGKVFAVGHFYNVYIRLRKRTDSGKSRYYLILNGFQIDKQVLTGTSRNMLALRQLGQQLAFSLGINYFDEPNVSPDHVLRHYRPSEQQRRKGQFDFV